MFLPKPEHIGIYPALLAELKWNKSAATAIAQTKEKQHPSARSQYTGDILLIGINYDKKSKTHQCVIEKFGQRISNCENKNWQKTAEGYVALPPSPEKQKRKNMI